MRDGTRRSRKIGLTQGGRVVNGKAHAKWSRVFSRDVWRRLSEESGSGLQVITENPSAAFYHPASADEYRAVLTLLPADLSRYLRAIVLRRSPRVDRERGIEARRRFQCVILNAFPRSRRVSAAGLRSATIRHDCRWGAVLVAVDGRPYLEWSAEAVRHYYLYHLFLHELGHLNQPDFHKLRRRESFAEDFALQWAGRLGKLTSEGAAQQGG
jgi:hypothetical protein